MELMFVRWATNAGAFKNAVDFKTVTLIDLDVYMVFADETNVEF